MSANIRASINAITPRPPPASAVVYEERSLYGKETIRLLRAPSIESEFVWKARSLRFAYNALQPRLNDGKCSAITLISVFRTHFPLDTQQSESEASDAVTKFRNSFGKVKYLHPQGFFDANGDDQTANMHKDPRPKSVCFLSVKFDLSMGILGSPFSDSQRCVLDYFLRLPQSSSKLQNVSTAADEGVSVSNASERKSLFSAATNLNSKFISTPGKHTSASQIDPPDFVNVIKDSTASAAGSKTSSAKDSSPDKSTASAAAGKKGSGAPQKRFSLFSQTQETTPNDDDDDNDSEDKEDGDDNNQPDPNAASSQNSNNSFDAVRVNLAPKTAELLASRRAGAAQCVRTYYGALDILDDQSSFISSGVQWGDMFELGVNNIGDVNVVEYEKLQMRINDMCQEIFFEVFCDRYSDSYVGTAYSAEDIDVITVEQVSKNLKFVKMQYKNSRSHEVITTTPDTIYKKMMEYVPILPSDATSWSFCLPSIYYNALTDQLREEMKIMEYVLPQPSKLPTKELQLESMLKCQSTAAEALRRVRLNEQSISKLISKEVTSLQVAANHLQPFPLSNVASMDPHGGRNTEQQTLPVLAYNPNSRAEDTIRREQWKKKRAVDLPPGFVQKFITVNGHQYPCHPADASQHSSFPLGFRGCFGCGGDHTFARCPTKRDPKCLEKFHWNLHCHMPDIFFHNRRDNGSLSRPNSVPRSDNLAPYAPQAHVQQPTLQLLPAPPQVPTPAHVNSIGRGIGATVPAWMGTQPQQPRQVLSRSIPPPPPLHPRPNDTVEDNYDLQDNGNFVSEYVMFLDSCSIQKSNLRPMPITSKNELPHLKLSLSEPGSNKHIGLSLLYDTGAALNTGFLPYHKKQREVA